MAKRTYLNTKALAYEVILNHFGGRCFYCFDTDKLHLHHITPVKWGGKNELNNLLLVCFKCHINLHAQLRLIYPHRSRKAGKLEMYLKRLSAQRSWD